MSPIVVNKIAVTNQGIDIQPRLSLPPLRPPSFLTALNMRRHLHL